MSGRDYRFICFNGVWIFKYEKAPGKSGKRDKKRLKRSGPCGPRRRLPRAAKAARGVASDDSLAVIFAV